jgi:hypothetical protein
MATTTTKPTDNGTKDRPATRRARLVGLTISLDVVIDDGATLTPVQIQPVVVTAAQWPTFDMAAVLAEVEAQTGAQVSPP